MALLDGGKQPDTFKKAREGLSKETSRTIAICLTFNDETEGSNIRFHKPSTYFESGTADESLPEEFTSGQSIAWCSRKFAGYFATGTVGVLVYQTSDDKTLAVMWSVPYNFWFYRSWWNVKMYDGTRDASEAMYQEMYANAEYNGDNRWRDRIIGQGYTIKGTMACSSAPSLEIQVTKTESM